MDELIKEEWQKPPTPLEFPSGLHLSPPDSPHSKVPTQAQEINGIGSSCDSLLAEEAMVHYPPTVEHIGSASSTVIGRPTLSGSSTSSKPGEAASDGLEAERARFLDQGCSQKEVETLLQARRPTTNSTYRRVWKNFFLPSHNSKVGTQPLHQRVRFWSFCSQAWKMALVQSSSVSLIRLDQNQVCSASPCYPVPKGLSKIKTPQKAFFPGLGSFNCSEGPV